MNIALDYDGTFTSDPLLWLMFIHNVLARKHSIYVVTMRYPSECDGTLGSIAQVLRDESVPIICTSRMAKRPYCLNLGIEIHVWIDDTPLAVDSDATTIWGIKSPEGAIVDPRYD